MAMMLRALEGHAPLSLLLELHTRPVTGEAPYPGSPLGLWRGRTPAPPPVGAGVLVA